MLGEGRCLQLITEQEGVVMLMNDRISRRPKSQSLVHRCAIPAESLFKDNKKEREECLKLFSHVQSIRCPMFTFCDG